MPPSIDNSVLFLIGVSRESQRSLANAAWTATDPHARRVLLDAFDQRTDMLDDLERLSPTAEPAQAVQVGWRSKQADKGPDLAACIAGEEATLQSAKSLWAESRDSVLRQVLQTHVLRVSALLARFRTLNSR